MTPGVFMPLMRICLAIHPWSDAGDPLEGAREMRRVAVAQLMRDIGHLHVRVLRHPAGDVEARLIHTSE